MAQLFHFGPYTSVTFNGLLPGESVRWSFGPFAWDGSALMISAHPLGHNAIGNRAFTVTDIHIENTATGAGEAQLVHCTVRNVGRDASNYVIWIGGIKP